MSADIITEDERAGWSIELVDSPLTRMRQLQVQPLMVYSNTVYLYTSRDLTMPEDILAAFNGIGNLLCGALGGALIHGLPSSHFDWALLWEAQDAPRRREGIDGERFPSWSWCGWQGEVVKYKATILSGCEANLHEWITSHTWISWYIRDVSGNLRLVWDAKDGQESTKGKGKRWRGYKKIKQDEDGCYDAYGRFVEPEDRARSRSKFELTLPEYPYSVSKLAVPDTVLPS